MEEEKKEAAAEEPQPQEEGGQKKKSFGGFLLANLWIFAALAGLLAYVALAMPIVSTKFVSDPDTRVGLYLWQMFGPDYGIRFNALVLIFWLLPGIGAILAALTPVHKNFLYASLLCFLLAGVLLVTQHQVFEYFLAGDYAYYKNVEQIVVDGKTDLEAGAIFASGMSFVGAAVAMVAGTTKDSYSVTDIAESGMLIALAFVLNLLKIPMGASGGSANFQMLPLFILALRQGPLKGFIGAGIVYGLLTCLTDGYGLATYPFDYLIGFGSACVFGFFKPLIYGKDQHNYNVKGEIFLFVAAVAATFIRFIGSTISSMVVYGYDFGSAALYNGVYIPVSGAIAIAVIMAAYGPLVKLNDFLERRSHKKKEA
jgi:thiamine transporter